MEILFQNWALLAGLIFNAGYLFSLIDQISKKEAGIPILTFILFAIATIGYIGYFLVVKPDTMMAYIAIAGFALICMNIAAALFYGNKSVKEVCDATG